MDDANDAAIPIIYITKRTINILDSIKPYTNGNPISHDRTGQTTTFWQQKDRRTRGS